MDRFIVAVPLAAIAMAATLAPKIEIYTILACEMYRPELTVPGHGESVIDIFGNIVTRGFEPITVLDGELVFHLYVDSLSPERTYQRVL